MALVPVSQLFEILFAVISILLLERPTALSKMVAIGLWTFEIPLLTLNQEFYSDVTGTLAETTIAFPSAILGYVMFGIVMVWIYEMYNAYAFAVDKKEL